VYEPVACETAGRSALATVWDGDKTFTDILFSNLKHPVRSVEMTVGSERIYLTRVGDRGIWHAEHGDLENKSVGFLLTPSSGPQISFSQCFGEFPVSPGVVCTVQVFGAETAAAPAAAGDGSSNHSAGSSDATDSSLRGGR
ncbi:unnamed protein product, partial [Polarella glacialis]